MDRLFQWLWDRYGPTYSWALFATCYVVPFPIYLFLASTVVAFEHSDRYLVAAGATAIAMPILAFGIVLPGIGPMRTVQRWAAGEKIDTAIALEATYVWARGAIARGVVACAMCGAVSAVLAKLQPLSLIALLATLVLLFGFQGEQILRQPAVIALLAVPILIQVYFNAGVAYLLNRISGEQHCVAGPSALIGASNFFELAVAAAISLFGFHSGAALATVVGVLVEVPVMLTVVRIVNSSKGWYERGAVQLGAR